jgi:hypothetical protein
VPRYLNLQTLFLDYFHPDWALDASRADVAREYVRNTPHETVATTVRELEALVSETPSERELHDLVLRDYSLFYDPWRDELGMREWLLGLVRDIRFAMESATR